MTDATRPVIFGEVLYDCFADGQTVLGGAPFNVAWHLQGFGLSPLLISRVGNDALGRRVKDTMHQHGMDSSGLQLDSAHPTGQVNITMNGHDHHFEIAPEQAYDYIDQDALPPMSDNALFYHGSLAARNPVSAQTLASLRARFSARRLIDVNLRSPWWQRNSVLELTNDAWLAKLNDEELLQLVPDAENDSVRMQQLIKHAKLQILVITRGSAGAEIQTANGEHFQIAPNSVAEIVDTIGAGDALTSILILGILHGWPYQKMLERSQLFASAIVANRGAIVEEPDFYQTFIDAWELS